MITTIVAFVAACFASWFIGMGMSLLAIVWMTEDDTKRILELKERLRDLDACRCGDGSAVPS